MKEVRIVNPDIFSPTYLSPTNNKDIVSTFKYEDGRYDRREREFFGFGKVTTYDMWYSNNVYRSKINFYHNKSYFLSGKLKKLKHTQESMILILQLNMSIPFINSKITIQRLIWITLLEKPMIPEGKKVEKWQLHYWELPERKILKMEVT